MYPSTLRITEVVILSTAAVKIRSCCNLFLTSYPNKVYNFHHVCIMFNIQLGFFYLQVGNPYFTHSGLWTMGFWTWRALSVLLDTTRSAFRLYLGSFWGPKRPCRFFFKNQKCLSNILGGLSEIQRYESAHIQRFSDSFICVLVSMGFP